MSILFIQNVAQTTQVCHQEQIVTEYRPCGELHKTALIELSESGDAILMTVSSNAETCSDTVKWHCCIGRKHKEIHYKDILQNLLWMCH